MKTLTLALFFVSSVASANWDDPMRIFDAKNDKETVSITWRAVDNVQKACEAESRNRGNKGFGYAVNACSFWEGNTCTIITQRRVNMHTLGHETLHCFKGNWH
jgi:hypothetical protein